MRIIPPNKIAEYAYNAGVKDRGALITAVAIAMAESRGGDADAVGDVGLQDSKWGPSIGLWQIRSLKAESGKGTIRDATRLKDPAYNAKSMYSISGGGTRWGDWTVYNIKTHLLFVPVVTPAVDAFLAGTAIGGVANDVAGKVEGVADMASAVPEALDATYGWVSNRQNWIRVAQVVIGGAVVLAGVAFIAQNTVLQSGGAQAIIKAVK